MADQDVPGTVTRGFMSYRRADNEDFRNVVDQLRQDITSMYAAMTGKEIHLFLDRESIGWGEDWRQKIHDSVKAASVFIPVVTMRYFTSTMCMEELLTFHAAANRLGVTELILPIVVFGASQITTEDSRPEVQLIARLNHKNAETAWVAGYDSPDWRAFVADCVGDLDKAIQRAEAALVAEEEAAGSATPTRPPSGGAPSLEHADEDSPLFDLEEMTERMNQVGPLTDRALLGLDSIGEIMEKIDFEGASPSATKIKMLNLSRQIGGPAEEIRAAGEELEATLFNLDSDVRSMVAEMSSINLPEARQQLIQLLDSFETDSPLSEVEDSIEQAIQMVRLISMTNVSLRKALQPATRGFRSIQNAVGIFRGWQQLRESLTT